MYSHQTARPLISVGQLKAMLDLRLVWDDGPPMLLFCSSGIKYVLIRARVFHGLPIISEEELKTLIAAVEDFTPLASSGAILIGKMLLVGTLKFLGIRCDEIILKQSRRGRRMRLYMLPVKGQMCKIVPTRAWPLHARLRSRMRSAMPGRVRRSMFASRLRRLKSMPLTKTLRILLHLILLLLPEKGN